ncbi:MAG: hypothetical protein A2W27_08450 [Deltaproteobacteria bacterium RBG_16_44_11]|nr:MAG: hypothetical protein A2W27_08450 [Deltaproteobacteria bacterium RBG_16_44_11]
MKKALLIKVLLLFCVVLFAPSVFAADGATTPRFKPSISIGYAFAVETDFTFESLDGVGLAGLIKADHEIPNFSGIYVAGDFLFNFTDRLNLSAGVKGTFPLTDEENAETINNGTAVRNWDTDKRYWYTADLLVSYAFIKDASFLKNLSAVAGFRYDYHKMSFDNARLTSGALVTLPTDTTDIKMQTFSPVLGITSTLQGFKSGIFGGDIKLSLLGSPFVFGKIDYTEGFGDPAFRFNVDDNFDHAYFFNVGVEVTAISAKIGPKADLIVSLFGQYTRFVIDDDVVLTANTGSAKNYNFEAQPNTAVIGIKTAIEF